jgi:hypothetical protein
MRLKELEGALDKRYAEKMSAEHKEEVERENFIRGARATNSKINRFWTELPYVVSDYLGRSEKKDAGEDVMVGAYKKDGAQHLRVGVGTNGTDRILM